MTSPERARVLRQVVDRLDAARPGHPLRVAVDGVTAAGKTTLAGELATLSRERGRPAIHLSLDGFHRPRVERHRQGRDSAVGYYQDAYAVLLVDGTFLQRPQLRPLWDEVVYVETAMDVALARAVARDADLLGGPQEAERLYRLRYHAACAMYLADVDPAGRATVVLGNDDLDAPSVRFVS